MTKKRENHEKRDFFTNVNNFYKYKNDISTQNTVISTIITYSECILTNF